MSEHPPREIAILGAELGTGNMGVSALAAGAVRWLMLRQPEAVISFLAYAKHNSSFSVALDGRMLELPVHQIRFSKRLYLVNNISTLLALALMAKLLPYERLRTWLIARNACLKQLYGVAAFAAISGGDSFSDLYGAARLFYVALPQILVILLGKPLLLLPQTIGPFRSTTSRIVAGYILKRAHHIYSRDYRSLDDIANLTGSGNLAHCSFGFDLGFILEPVAPKVLDIDGLSLEEHPGSVLVGLNVSGLLFRTHPRNNVFGLRTGYGTLLSALIEHLIVRKKAAVLLVPHVLGETASAESDADACKDLYKSLGDIYRGRLGIVRGMYDQHELKYIIGRCGFFIGSRMHACIAALSQHIPTVSIAYSDKFLGVMETIGVETLVADARHLDSGEIIALLDRAYEARSDISRHLRRKMAAVVQALLDPSATAPFDLDDGNTTRLARGRSAAAKVMP